MRMVGVRVAPLSRAQGEGSGVRAALSFGVLAVLSRGGTSAHSLFCSPSPPRPLAGEGVGGPWGSGEAEGPHGRVWRGAFRGRGLMPVDPITLELVKNAVESVVDEMALTMMRTAYSSNLKSSNDLSSAYCSLDGELLAQGFTLPMQLGSIPDAMVAVIAKFGGTFEPGDVVILNDPYEGGTHLPDIFLIKPIFLDGEHVAYCATIAHHTDIGGRVAGGNASDSTEIYQEGLRLPPIKLYDAGTPNQAVFDIIEKNVRVSENLLGDLRAQLA